MGVSPRGKKFTATLHIGGGKKQWLGTHDTYEDALEAWLKARKDPARSNKETVTAFCDRYLDDYNRSSKDGRDRWEESTMKGIRVAMKPFRETFGHHKMRDFGQMTAGDVRPWIQSQPLAYAQRMRTMMNDAEADGLIARNPLGLVRLAHSVGRRDIVVLTEPELEELFTIARSMWDEFGPIFEAMVATAAYTCIRPGELFALRTRDINLREGELDVMLARSERIKRPKGGKPRPGRVLLPQAAQRIASIPRNLAERPCPKCSGQRDCIVCHGSGKVRWLFESPRGRLFDRGKLYHYWNPVRRAAGLGSMDFYELRHAGATLLLERGLSQSDVAWQMGHVNTKKVDELYGEPHRSAAGRRERIKRAFGQNVTPIREREAASGG